MFSGKNRKNIASLLSAELAKRVVKVISLGTGQNMKCILVDTIFMLNIGTLLLLPVLLKF